MDLGNTIIGVFLLAIFIIPIVLIQYRRKNKENKKLQSLREIARQHNCSISQHEFCGDFVLGIDMNRNFVFFSKYKKEEFINQFVDLTKIKSCQPLKKIRSIKMDKGNEIIIERIELAFTPKIKSEIETSFVLFDETINNQLSGELQFAEKWAKQINEVLKNRS